MKPWLVNALVAAWLSAIGVCVHTLWIYKTTPGAAAEAPATWPAESGLARVDGKPTLILLAHPRCPCTQASIDELNVVLNQLQDRVTAHVLFVVPPGIEPGWEQSYAWTRAHELPGARVIRDDGHESALFNAFTSGQTLLYDAAGQLAFNGGITAIRGHQGDNVGRRQILALVEGGATLTSSSSVFGCALHEDSAPAGPW